MKFEGVHIFDYDATFRGDVTIEGNLTISNSVSQTISFGDNDKLKFGDSQDLQLFHNGTHSLIENHTGDLYVTNFNNDGDIIFRSDDGSGDVTAYLTLDGSAGYTVANKDIYLVDDVRLRAGTGGDFSFFHDGSNSKINNNTGNIRIENFQDDGDIQFFTDDGSGGTAEYLRFDGGVAATYVYKDFKIQDSVYFNFGTSNDFLIGHDSANTRLYNYTGNLQITNLADDQDIIFQCDDGSGGVETYFFLDGSASAGAPFTVFPDSSNLTIGTGFDLRLKHDGSHSYIQQTGTGDLYIQNTVNDKDIIFQSDDGSGGVETYFFLDGSNGLTTFPDDKVLGFGNASDLRIKHDSSNS